MALAELDEIVREMHGDIKVLRQQMERVEGHATKTNGHIADLMANDHRQEGALSVLKWMVGVTLGVMGLGVGVAGLVLGVLMRGG